MFTKFACLATVLAFAAVAPAHAAGTWNGARVNGFVLNGFSLNGTAMPSSTLTIDGIELPAAQH